MYILSPCYPVKGICSSRVQDNIISYIVANTSPTSCSARELELEPTEAESASRKSVAAAKGLLLTNTTPDIYYCQQQQSLPYQRSHRHHRHERGLKYKCTNRLVQNRSTKFTLFEDN